MGTFLQINYSLKNGEWTNPRILSSIRNSIPTFFGYYPTSQFDSYKTEREIEQNSEVFKLKDGKIIQPLINDIIQNIGINFNINEIDYITFTPDSGNNNSNNIELKGFSIICDYIANELNIPIIIPEITKGMEKQKTQSYKNRILNKRGGYAFKKEDIEGKTILFLNDVITTGSTMCAIGEDIVKKGGFFVGYGIAQSELDSYNK